MELKRDGDSLSGSYFYHKSGSGNKLTLKGKIAADGNFSLQEFTAAGKQTERCARKVRPVGPVEPFACDLRQTGGTLRHLPRR